MNIVKEKNEDISFIVENYIFKHLDELDDKNCIIAGGFLVNAWFLSRIMKDNMFKKPIKDAVYNANLNHLESKVIYSRSGEFYNVSNLIKNFGDIDIWFKKGFKVDNSFFADSIEFKDIDYTHTNLEYTFGSAKMTMSSSSKWANTFRYRNCPSLPVYQFIKKQPESVKELFQDFDFNNCCFAYHDGHFYYTEEAVKAFEDCVLSLNNDKKFVKNTVAGKVYSGLRSFKYAKRYNLDFDKNLSNHIYKIMFEASQIGEEEYNDMRSDDINGYIQTNCDYRTFYSMTESFIANVRIFSEMKNYKSFWSAYLIGSANEFSEIRKLFNKNARKIDVLF